MVDVHIRPLEALFNPSPISGVTSRHLTWGVLFQGGLAPFGKQEGFHPLQNPLPSEVQ